MAPFRHSRSRLERGFSLVELMVGLVIGLIAVIVIMQVFQISESSRRTTVGGDDAQMSGTLSLSALQREIQQAGYGSSAFPIIGCSLRVPGGWTVPVLAPVTINPAGIPAGDLNTDVLMVIYGSTNGSPEGDLVAAQATQANYSVATPTSFATNDLIVAEVTPRPAPCALTLELVTNKTDVPPVVTVATGVPGMINGTLYNFGMTPRFQVFAVRNSNLTVCDYLINDCSNAANVADATVWVPVGNGIVSLRAVYGKDKSVPMDGSVDPPYDRIAPATACDWARVSAVQMALVTQSGEFDKSLGVDVAVIPPPDWRASDVVPIDLSNIANWQSFRYKVFQTTVPVRNMAWQGAQSGC